MIELRIRRIDVFGVNILYSDGMCTLSGGRTYTSFDATMVCITANTGIQGWGEGTPFGSTYIVPHALDVKAGITEIAP
jgi:L-alanine-DL-glutamate epimerase-like enolase superfamily enzyme